jgi:hypothetical protein
MAKTVSKLTNSEVEFDKVCYRHRLLENAVVEHVDDEKRFGPCRSKTTVVKDVSQNMVVTVKWFLKTGLLLVNHFVDEQDRLHEELHFYPMGKGTTPCTASKVYHRAHAESPVCALAQQNLTASLGSVKWW